MKLPEIATVVTILVALAGIVMTFVRYGPERRGVLIREEEGSFNILNSLTLTLQNELKRKDELLEAAHAKIAAQEIELAGLRKAAGRRQGDTDAAADE